MKQYLLSIYQPDGDPPPPEILEPIMKDIEAVDAEMRAAGAWVFTGGLHPPDTATVLRADGGDVLITDGPFAEGKEHVGGFWIIRRAGSGRRARLGAQGRGRVPAPGRGPADGRPGGGLTIGDAGGPRPPTSSASSARSTAARWPS